MKVTAVFYITNEFIQCSSTLRIRLHLPFFLIKFINFYTVKFQNVISLGLSINIIVTYIDEIEGTRISSYLFFKSRKNINTSFFFIKVVKFHYIF